MKIFISHSSNDKWVAKKISEQLIAEGHGTFLDEKDIKTGDSIDSEIQHHLKDSDHLLILVSPSSLKSHWVFLEIGGAKALGKKVIPILLHVEANEVPAPIAQLLARDINNLDKYVEEISVKIRASGKRPKRLIPSRPEKMVGAFSIGEKVKVVEVGHLTDEDKEKTPKWNDKMDKYSGAVATIKSFNEFGRAELDVDEGKFRWRTEWLIKLG